MLLVKVNTWIVYSHSIDGQIFYIGSGIWSRAFEAGNRRATSWIDHVQSNGGEYAVDVLGVFNSRQEACAFEAQLINKLTPNCNFRMTERHHSDDARLKIGTKHRGKVLSAETKSKISKKRIHAINNGTSLMPDTTKMNVLRRPVICTTSGKKYNSIAHAARETGISYDGLKRGLRAYQTFYSSGLAFSFLE